jgi:hypothetical protein
VREERVEPSGGRCAVIGAGEGAKVSERERESESAMQVQEEAFVSV